MRDGQLHIPEKLLSSIMPANADREDFLEYRVEGILMGLEKREEFIVKQGYEEERTKTIVCKICGADNFKVGQGGYFTAIKCLTCEWEICIHEG